MKDPVKGLCGSFMDKPLRVECCCDEGWTAVVWVCEGLFPLPAVPSSTSSPVTPLAVSPPPLACVFLFWDVYVDVLSCDSRLLPLQTCPCAAKATTLFRKQTKAIVWGMQTRAVQGMLDFDYICSRDEPSVAAMVYPFTWVYISYYRLKLNSSDVCFVILNCAYSFVVYWRNLSFILKL